MMNNKTLSIELITSEESFVAIKDEWDQLIEKSYNSSVYDTYPFVYTVWKHYRSENDQLFILVVRRGETLVGIAPFRIERVKLGNMRLIREIRLRRIRFIAEWGNGDKPSIVTTEEPELIWETIFQYLNKDYTQWDIISLAEQPENSPVLNQKLLSNIWYSLMVLPESTSYFISITGTWDEYIKKRKNTQRTWKKDRKRLFARPEGVDFQCFDDPDNLSGALHRFIGIEQSGWKKNSNFSIGGSEKQKVFFEELLIQLAQKNMAAIYLLTLGNTDIAGALRFKYNTTIYASQITYDPLYAEYSPGVILNAEIIQSMFGTHYKKYDLLGFKGEENSLKKNWSTGSQQTIRIQVYKKTLFSLLYANEDSLKHMPQKFMAIIFGTMEDISKFFKGTLAYIT